MPLTGNQYVRCDSQKPRVITMVRKPLIGALLAIGLVYGAYPFVTLYRLGHAIRQGDVSALQSMVDWGSVREGIKEDICDFVSDEQQQAGDQLPAFGEGFVRGIATNVIDRRVTPEALAAAAQQSDPIALSGAALQVSWAFFASPSAFVVDLVSPEHMAPIRLQMELRDGMWQVTRVWLPPELLGQANPRNLIHWPV
jgi:hypothetical protein